MQTSQKLQVAKTIIEQLGKQTLFMLGAKNLVGDETSLSLRIRGSNRVNYMKITLNAMDTYDMEFGKIHGMNYKIVATLEGCYDDMLHKMIEQETGLCTKLF